MTQGLETPQALLIRALSPGQEEVVAHYYQVDLRQVEAHLAAFLISEVLLKPGVRKIAFDAKILIKMLLRCLPNFSLEQVSGKSNVPVPSGR